MHIHRNPEDVREGFESYDARFEQLLPTGAQLERHCTGMQWAEGPVYVPWGDYILWSDIPNNRMMKWSNADGCSVFRQPSGYTNGNYLDNLGRLVSCEHGGRRISRTERNGKVKTLVDNYRGSRLNSPNDLVVKSDNTIWFTDPPYGILSDREGQKSESELGANYVFRFDPTSGSLKIVADQLDRPNGICFSPDEQVLYLSDTGKARNILAFDVVHGNELTNKRIFASVRPGMADGFRVDSTGTLFTSSWDGIQVYSSKGELLGKILVPEDRTANCVFGGTNRNRLYITADQSLYSIRLNTRGAQLP